nr:hypothetical protein [Bacillota bacterium]
MLKFRHIHQPLGHGVQRRLGAVGQAQFRQDLADVLLHRGLRDRQVVGNLLRTHAPGQGCQHVQLPVRQLLQAAAAAHRGQHHVHHRGVHVGPALGRAPDRRHHVLRRGLLGEHRGDAQFHGAPDRGRVQH